MKKLNVNRVLFILFVMTPILFLGQEKKIDGVAAVVGDEVVLDSDIERDFMMAKQQGMEVPDKCAFVNNILIQRMILHKAKNDTLVSVSDERVKAHATNVLEDFRGRGSDEEILKVYGVKTIAELQSELEIMVKENQMITSKRELIEKDTDASPLEVRDFFNTYQSELPNINEEVEIAHIVIHPEIKEEHKQKMIDELKKMKQEIEEGASFETKAILYSDDPGSKNKGGLYENVKRGSFVPEFDAVAFNLEEGEISEPVETEFGFHIIKLDKRRGQSIDVRHILLQFEPTKEEINTAKQKLDSIRSQILLEKMTFKEAAFKYSVDKYTRYNGGIMTNMQTKEIRFERSKLPTSQLYAIAGMNEGEISSPFESEHDRKKSLEIIKLNKIIPAHKVDLETDYTRIKNMTIQKKKQEKLYNFIKSELPTTFIKINKDYQSCDFEFNWLKK